VALPNPRHFLSGVLDCNLMLDGDFASVGYAAAQFSTRRPSTLRNSRTLFVTRPYS
jgi:hypothetical protein